MRLLRLCSPQLSTGAQLLLLPDVAAECQYLLQLLGISATPEQLRVRVGRHIYRSVCG